MNIYLHSLSLSLPLPLTWEAENAERDCSSISWMYSDPTTDIFILSIRYEAEVEGGKMVFLSIPIFHLI